MLSVNWMTELKVILIDWFCLFGFKLSLKLFWVHNWRSRIFLPFFLLGQNDLLVVRVLNFFERKNNVNLWFYLRLPVFWQCYLFSWKFEWLLWDFDRLDNTITFCGIIQCIMLDVAHQSILHVEHFPLNWCRKQILLQLFLFKESIGTTLCFAVCWNLNNTFSFDLSFCWASRSSEDLNKVRKALPNS